MGRGPTINRRRLDEIRAIKRPGASSLLDRVIQLFEEESAELLSALENAIQHRQAEAVRAAAHKFKSVSGNIGADALASWCLELEMKGEEDRLDGSVEILEEIRVEHGRASAELVSELTRVRGD